MKLSKYIDNTLLKPTATQADIEKFAKESAPYDFASICILPGHIEYAKDILAGTDVKIATVVGFPLGLNTTATKVFETKDAIERGAHEIDMVINISWAQDKQYDRIKSEVKAIYEAVKSLGEDKLLKVIIETCYLDYEGIKEISSLCKEVGVEFVKTSTGFGTAGAQLEDVQLMKEVLGEYPEIKASGGVRTYEDAAKFIEAGAMRLGTSGGFNIVDKSDNDKDSDY
ncbi:deoxyribose-phosphate aldolase [Irregularibacter muris]|uniref:Deoxyribose-phosphate aldolase n=1 Tax=Irregularibacter muris TaxID=1796619 RepID=A0AAE3HCI4_9FIRM|nr:deoxyribose-phosphate aldolase [Irregularibacter muris]MCR1897580.1 deoxyribose-phosphate aldolase [Irregularibacter muris]